MINQLRKKFILVAMGCVIVVLGAIIGMINIFNYVSINQNADETINYIAENNGTIPHKERNFNDVNNFPMENHKFSEEMPFSTRFFTVILNDQGTVVTINTGQIAAISTEQAGSYAQSLFEKNKQEGYINVYKYKAVETQNGTMYIFLDRQMELRSFYNFLTVSIITSLLGIVAVFILVFISSKMILKPVEESYKKQKQFITDASHEIKTPLTIIGASTEVLEMDVGESQWTESIKNQVGRLTELTEKLVFLSRMDEDGVKIPMMNFSISESVAQAAEIFIPISESLHKNLELNIEENIYYYGQEENIRQMIGLLVDNAMKYSNPMGTTWVKLYKEGKSVNIEVSNTVEYMEPGDYSILFERFYRKDDSRNSSTGGNGIGLSVVKAIVEEHHGKIKAICDGNMISFKIKL